MAQGERSRIQAQSSPQQHSRKRPRSHTSVRLQQRSVPNSGRAPLASCATQASGNPARVGVGAAK
eukprot:12168045-Alexandrium_andersonii.AAC.1